MREGFSQLHCKGILNIVLNISLEKHPKNRARCLYLTGLLCLDTGCAIVEVRIVGSEGCPNLEVHPNTAYKCILHFPGLERCTCWILCCFIIRF